MRSIRRYTVLAIAALSLAGLAPIAHATTPLHQFTNDLSGNADGAFPKAGLIIDAKGALYGTTNEGGSNGYGTVFKLAPTPNGPPPGNTPRSTASASQPDCIDGSYPEGGVTADAQGNLYGTTSEGGGTVLTGPLNFGTVFKLTPCQWRGYTESVLYSFSGLSDGAYPKAGLLWLNGELYGTTEEGGNSGFNGCLDIGCGVVFKLTPTANRPLETDGALHLFGLTRTVPTHLPAWSPMPRAISTARRRLGWHGLHAHTARHRERHVEIHACCTSSSPTMTVARLPEAACSWAREGISTVPPMKGAHRTPAV